MPPAERPIEDPREGWNLRDATHLWCVRLGAGCLDRAHALLSPDERARAARFQSSELVERYVLSHAVLRVLLSRVCGAPPERLVFAAGPYGKPALADPQSPVRFNLSHSGDIAAYAVRMRGEVGVDVERVRPVPDLADIAARFLPEAEARNLMSLPEPLRAVAFFRAWTRNEARLKAAGLGLAESGREDAAAGEYSLYEFEPAAGFVGALAYAGPASAVLQHPVADADAILAG